MFILSAVLQPKYTKLSNIKGGGLKQNTKTSSFSQLDFVKKILTSNYLSSYNHPVKYLTNI